LKGWLFLLLTTTVAAEPEYRRPFQVTLVTPAPLYSVPGTGAVISGAEIALSHEGQLEVHSTADGGLLRSQKLPKLWSFQAGRVVWADGRSLQSQGWKVTLPYIPRSLSLDSQGRIWATSEREVRWLDANNGHTRRSYKARPSVVNAYCSHGSNQVIYTSGWGRNAGGDFALDVATGKAGILMEHTEDVDSLSHLSFSGDASIALTEFVSLPGDYRFEIAQVRKLGPDGLQTTPMLSAAESIASNVASSGPWVAYSYGDCLEILHLPKNLLFRLPVRASWLGFGAQHRLAVQRDGQVEVYDPTALLSGHH